MDDTLKMPTSEKTTTITSLRDVPPGKMFRLQKTGTLYMKMADGSIRNVDKAVRKHLKHMKKSGLLLNQLAESAQTAMESTKDLTTELKEIETK